MSISMTISVSAVVSVIGFAPLKPSSKENWENLKFLIMINVSAV